MQRNSFHSTSANAESNSEKLRALNDKFDILESQETRLSLKRKAFFSDYVEEMEYKVLTTSEEGDKALKLVEDELLTISDEFIKDKRMFILNNEKEKGVLFGLENDLMGTLEFDNENYKRKMEDYREEFESRVENLIENVNGNNRIRNEIFEKNTKEVEGIMDELEGKLVEAKTIREKKENLILKDFSEEIEKTCGMLELEKNVRENTENKMKNMIKEVTESLMKEIEVNNNWRGFCFESFVLRKKNRSEKRTTRS